MCSVVGCASAAKNDRFNVYNKAKGYKAMAVGVYLDDYGNATRNGGWGIARQWQNQNVADSGALKECRKYNKLPYICVLEYSGQKFVYSENIQKLKNKSDKEQKEQLAKTIEELRVTCKSYGFNSDNAIATCVQREINLEKDRILANQMAQKNQPIIQQVQPNYRNSQPNYDALSSMGSCLQNEGSFAACSNAWQGYTPPRKTVTKCRYDTFGNVINGTCTTQ